MWTWFFNLSGNPLTEKSAKVLAESKRRLRLSGLTTLSAEAAKALQANPRIFLPDEFAK